ncbi:HU family DNA-binding protein [Enterobacter hormaechei]|nr:HU family DNA-binding protein [Enterobacter hormaechei]
MTKAELIIHLADTHRISRAQAAAIVKDISKCLIDDLFASGVAVLHDIGRLKVIKRNARIGRNPKSGDAISIPATHSLKLTVTKDLKEALKAL